MNKNRYSRQELFPKIGSPGQLELQRSRVLIVGCGALGASHAEILSRAGVGFLRLVDRDFVEFSNLQRQTLFSENDASARLPKSVAAKRRITEINSEIEIDAVVADVNHSNIESLFDRIDLVLDGTDNFQVRYLINDAAVKLKKTWIYGAAVASYGTTMTIFPGKTPCLRCIFEEIPSAGSSPTCDTAGVIQPIITSISAIQTTEALKILTGRHEDVHGSLIQIDVWENDWRKIKLGDPNSDCPACGMKNFEFLDAGSADFFTALCGRDAVQIQPFNAAEIDLSKLAESLKEIGTIKVNEYLVRLNIDEFELTIFKDARAIIKGTEDISTARALYAKYIGS